jgi:hypothetical protein
MAANAPSAGSGGSGGIARERDRVRKNLYAAALRAADCSFGRGVSPPGMHAAGGDEWLRAPPRGNAPSKKKFCNLSHICRRSSWYIIAWNSGSPRDKFWLHW